MGGAQYRCEQCRKMFRLNAAAARKPKKCARCCRLEREEKKQAFPLHNLDKRLGGNGK